MAHGMNGHDFTTKVPSTERLLTTQEHGGKGGRGGGLILRTSSYTRVVTNTTGMHEEASRKDIYIKISRMSRRPAAA